MRFRDTKNISPPQVDLIPMMDVLMTILTFFIIVSMTLGNEQSIDMQLPPAQTEDQPPPLTTQPFIVSMEANGGFRVNNTPIDKDTLIGQMEAHLAADDDHIVYLLPDRDLPYEQVIQFLGEMRAIGGDRVSLAIEE